ncbi:hypothetical protein B0H10DRAFT_2054909 [Mycena sp. CBHHK59/15]|nr:hypothetical protein B0H10DRAFT_2054909 [Mycena sp. CBHHK59/15]
MRPPKSPSDRLLRSRLAPPVRPAPSTRLAHAPTDHLQTCRPPNDSNSAPASVCRIHPRIVPGSRALLVGRRVVHCGRTGYDVVVSHPRRRVCPRPTPPTRVALEPLPLLLDC